MPVIADPDELDEGEEFELTPEQQEAVRQYMEKLRRAFEPKIDINAVTGASAFAKLAADMVKLPTFKLADSTLKNLSVMSGIAAQQSKILDSFKPMFAAQGAWKKQFAVINSDIFKSTALAQPNLNSITAQLTKNVDFGLSDSFAKLAQQVAAQQSAWLKTIGPALESLKLSFYPSNLRAIEGLRFEEVEQVVMVDGIALYGVPRTSIAEALIRAEGASKRRDILGRKWKTISADCHAAVKGCGSEVMTPYVPFAVAALDALDGGHTAAAQALTGSLVDSIVNNYFGKDRYRYTPSKTNKSSEAYDEFTAHEFIAFAPIWQAWQQCFPHKGDAIPTTFSRNATVHSVSPKQFTRRNAVQGLMIVCALLVFLDEQAVALAS